MERVTLSANDEQNKKTEIHLYCGFRKATETVLGYENLLLK
jgi:sulfite reductase (NADPH) flavoprotein alpha-component